MQRKVVCKSLSHWICFSHKLNNWQLFHFSLIILSEFRRSSSGRSWTNIAYRDVPGNGQLNRWYEPWGLLKDSCNPGMHTGQHCFWSLGLWKSMHLWHLPQFHSIIFQHCMNLHAYARLMSSWKSWLWNHALMLLHQGLDVLCWLLASCWNIFKHQYRGWKHQNKDLNLNVCYT